MKKAGEREDVEKGSKKNYVKQAWKYEKKIGLILKSVRVLLKFHLNFVLIKNIFFLYIM